MRSSAETSAGRQGRRLISYGELPAWSHDNDFIMHGYRAPGGTRKSLKEEKDGGVVENGHGKEAVNGARRRGRNTAKSDDKQDGGDEDGLSVDGIEEHDSFRRCWESVWLYVHNETVNIHTHLWGAAIVILSFGLHLLGAFERLPAWLHPLTHHSIFYPSSINPIPASAKHSVWRSWITRSDRLAATPLMLNALLSTPGHDALFPWHAIRPRTNDWSDWLGFASYLIGALTVLTCSATFHTVACHSQQVARSYNKLDYVGIVAMIVGSFLPMVHYGFYCHPYLQLIYSFMILSLGAAAAYTVLSHKFTSPAYRPLRTSVFIALGLSAVFPVTHILAMYGYEAVSRTMGLNFLVCGGALYILGACLYMARIPERLSPGTFDYFGASHQLFHVLILIAAFCHYVCIRRAHIFWHTVEAIASNDGGTQRAATQAVCAAFDTLRHGK